MPEGRTPDEWPKRVGSFFLGALVLGVCWTMYDVRILEIWRDTTLPEMRGRVETIEGKCWALESRLESLERLALEEGEFVSLRWRVDELRAAHGIIPKELANGDD